jgi:hypothetical protein
MGFMDLFKSEDRRWVEAKQEAHQWRAANGMKVSKSCRSYTPQAQITDQQRVERAKRK